MHSPDTIGSDTLTAGSRALWGVVTAMGLALVASYWATGLSVNAWSNPAIVGAFAILAVMTFIYRHVRPNEQLCCVLQATMQLLLVLLLGLLLTYAATAASWSYRNAELLAADRWMGLDQQAYAAFISRSPWLSQLFSIVYLSIQPQVALVPLALVVAGQLGRLQHFVMAFALALSATVIISVFVPALPAYALKESGLDPLAPAFPFTPVPTIEALRAGILRTVALDNLEGLIAFPSFHTAAALLFAWAAWPLRYVRWPCAILNLGMVATTPFDGGHYFIDLVGGALVVAAAIPLAARVLRVARRREIAAPTGPLRRPARVS